ncbi:hypothetical protein RB614_15905 [Phytohabitans sp. ZYX-F-186]|uniref:Cysteine dioxygenase n=1 Tax=Phytohabitans maris TaxID=3071409 RepID=A0ABU0ZG10_9ACTN|nr:hypothetical protein [Phytohabitans sp. ZYX-F-186]MDQ7905997.1 hypothetical protein [Phytohabitans sp. ZYX-F-186]
MAAASTAKTLPDLAEPVLALLGQRDPIRTAEAGDVLRSIGEPAALRHLIGSVLASDDLAEALARRSYPHPLGFDKIILLSQQPLGQLRLHIWWPETARRREHVHNHRFAFASFVVTGEVRMRVYRPSDDGEALVHFRETSLAAEGVWEFQRLGDTRLRLCLNADLGAGSTYAMPADALHRIDASPLLTATLFLETRSVREHSSIYADREGLPRPARRRVFSAADLRDRLSRLDDQLRRAPARQLVAQAG